MSYRNRILMALASGLLFFLAFPGPVGLASMAWLALVPLFLAINGAPFGLAWRLGLAAGLVHYLSLLYWIIIVLGRYGHLAWWVSLPALILLALYMGLYIAFFAGLANRLMQRGTSFVWTAPALWVVFDFLRGVVLSGFPWQDLAYSQYEHPQLLQVADLFGHHGLTFLIVMVNSLVFLLLTQGPPSWKKNRPAYLWILSGLLVLALAATYNFMRYRDIASDLKNTASIRVTAVQGDIAQDLKWTPALQQETVAIYTDLSRQALAAAGSRPTLLVWPETALPFYPHNNPLFPELQANFVKAEKIWLLTGSPYYESILMPDQQTPFGYTQTPRYYNSALLLSPDGEITARYDKQHLVPFGEYLPLRRYLPLPGPLVESIGDFTPGGPGVPISCQNARIGVLICFESIFPELAGKWVERGANLLVNITNDAWFGRSSAPWQHLSMAVLRAVENRRSLVRAANTGISGFVDPLGRLIKTSPLFTQRFLTADVPLFEEKTLFVRFGRVAFIVFCFLVALAGLAVSLLKKENSPRATCM